MTAQSLPPIHTVAVIGAGIAGVCSAAHLLKQGLSTTVFERSSIAGGVWHFDPRSASEPAYPNEVASRGDYDRVLFDDEDAYTTPPRTPEWEGTSPRSDQHENNKSTNEQSLWNDLSLAHAPPGPCYAGLKNNVSLTAMKTSLAAWPAGLEEFVSQQYLEEYIQSIAATHNVNSITRYNTRVEDVSKVGDKWRIRTTTLPLRKSSPPHLPPTLIKKTEYFDAVVVASGHYHMPRVPDIPGLKEWKAAYPDRISHSKGYRNPARFHNKNVLIIGAGVSSWDISKEIDSVVGQTFQSSRGGTYDLPASVLPASAHRIPGISSFTLHNNNNNTNNHNTQSNSPLNPNDPIPGHITLTNNTPLPPIHHIILATGYITSYPFLPTLHDDITPLSTTTTPDKTLLVTREGNMVHNLHAEIFYIPDPTLSFIGVPYHVSTFSLFDFQAQVLARVFAGKVKLPSTDAMRKVYEERVARKGLGRDFHSLRAEGAEIEYVGGLVEWVNRGVEGEERMVGHTDEWFEAHWVQRRKLAERFGGLWTGPARGVTVPT